MAKSERESPKEPGKLRPQSNAKELSPARREELLAFIREEFANGKSPIAVAFNPKLQLSVPKVLELLRHALRKESPST